jgi:hypothetical protein
MALQMSETICRHVCEMVQVLREEFRLLQFDFHSCFFYEEEVKRNEDY